MSDDIEEPATDEPEIRFDEEFVRAATIKEPSARTRMLTEEWKRRPPQDPGGRRDVRPPRYEPPERKRVWPRNLIAMVTAAAVTVGVVALYRAHHSPDPASAAGPAASASVSPSVASSAPTTPSGPPPGGYFVDSPAAHYADGAAGLVVPRAKAVGSFSASEVAQDYAALKRLFVDADLEPAVLAGGTPTALMAALDPKNPTLAELRTALAKPSEANNPVQYVTRFDAHDTRVLGHTVKVHGSMTARAGSDGTLVVSGDFIFVYAVAPVGNSSAWARTLVQRYIALDFVPENGRWEIPPAGTYWVRENYASTANDRCGVYNGYVNPDFTHASVTHGKPVDPYVLTPPSAVASPTPTSGSSTQQCRPVIGV